MDFTQIFNAIVHLVYIAIGGFVGKYVKDHLVGKIKSFYAVMAVKFVEQTLKSSESKAKFDTAAKFLSARLKKIHIKVSADEIEGLIESAVLELNSTLDKIVVSPTPVQPQQPAK
jgi:hypothetical protein